MSRPETHGTALALSPGILFDRNPQPMWIIERDTLKFLSVNEAALRHYGYSREEFLALSARDLLLREEAPPVGRPEKHVTKDGTVIDVEIAVADLSHDGVAASLVVVHDVTLRLRAERLLARSERSLKLLQTIFDRIPVMIVCYDAQGRPLLANREFTGVLGWTLEDLEGRDFVGTFYPEPETRREVEEFIRASTGRWRDFRTQTRGGQVIDAAWASVALSDGTRIGIGQDVTDRKRADEERGRFWRSELAARAQAESALARLRQIQSVTDAAVAHLGLDDLLRVTLARLRAVLGADVANVFLLSEDSRWVTVRASEGVEGALSPIGDSLAVGRGVAGRVAELRQGVIIDDVATLEGIRQSLSGSVQSVMAVPLLVEGQLVGVVDVGTRARRHFSDEDLRFLQMVADRVAPAIDRARLVEKLNAGREQLSALSRRLVEAQESERRELARELHDEVGQLLTGLKLMLETSGDRDGRRREEMTSIVNDLMTRVRGLSMSLRPPMLDDLGVVPALLWLVEHYTSQTGVVVEFGHEGVSTRFPPAVETAAFRIAQEALTNVARHAHVKRATMVVDADAERLCVEVWDHGRGFDVLATRGMASAGLAGMRERARLVGGRVTLESAPGEGTRVRAVLPLGGPAAAGEA
jgi:PAS domain S-box-containing protein